MRDADAFEAQSIGLSGAMQRFLVFEQCHLWKPESFRLSGFDTRGVARYLPEFGAVFRVPCFRIKGKYLYRYGEPEKSAGDVWDDEGKGPEVPILFPVHPAELECYAEFLERVGAVDAVVDGLRLWGTPTSSARTLLVWPEGNPKRAFFAKLSVCSGVLGDRRLNRRVVARSVGLSQFLDHRGSDLPSAIRCFTEPLGLTPRRMTDRGTLFRSVPRDLSDGGVVVAPLFALIGGSGSHTPLFLQWIEKNRVSALEVMEKVLLAGFARLWVDLVFDCGLILEAHGQDLLLALSPDLVPLGGFYYRDFEGLAVDWALRRARGVADPETLPATFEWFSTYETWGYPLYQLVSVKLRTSLFDYLRFVLAELESAMRIWQASGKMAGERVGEGDLTLLFSRYLRRAIQDKFGMSETEEYNIHGHLNRFVKFLMRVRKEVMQASADLG